jgi:hypothetical protein
VCLSVSLQSKLFIHELLVICGSILAFYIQTNILPSFSCLSIQFRLFLSSPDAEMVLSCTCIIRCKSYQSFWHNLDHVLKYYNFVVVGPKRCTLGTVVNGIYIYHIGIIYTSIDIRPCDLY